ncbi:DEVIL-like protein [Senna tora]|uniref:DEVIL-like protein n=1 Tax=Senna tora TaxID=362788 RepID=A0A834X1Y3_9FABA|nr:DEVIL-like protein [Senna tora]
MAVSHFAAKPQYPCRRTDRETGRSFRKRCFQMAKQQKTRFYILGRCITMLLCWHDHAISD